MNNNSKDTSEYVSIGFLVVKSGGHPNKDEVKEERTEPHFVNIDAHLRFVENLFSLKKGEEDLDLEQG